MLGVVSPKFYQDAKFKAMLLSSDFIVPKFYKFY